MDETMDWLTIALIVVVGLILIIFVAALPFLGSRKKDKRPKDEEKEEDRQPRRPTWRPLTHQEEWEAFGAGGEDEVFAILGEIAQSSGGYIYQNVAFKDDNGYSTEIDIVLICPGGFFVVEVKSNVGIIRGQVEDKTWEAEKEEWQDDKEFRNPIKQNAGHIHHLKRMMGKGAPYMESMVIFPYADIDLIDSPIVHDCGSAKQVIQERIKEEKYSKKTVERFNNQFKSLVARYGITHEEHVGIIHNRYDA